MSKTHWKKVVSDPNYIGEADFQEGEEKIVTIRNVVQKESVQTAEGKSDKAVVHFAESGIKPMILNVTRSKSISKVAGSDYFEDWPGVRIKLYVEKGIPAFGERVNAVRVRNVKPRESAPIPPCASCGGVIAPAKGKSAEWMVEYTTQKYERPLCADCAAAIKTAREQAEATTENDINE